MKLKRNQVVRIKSSNNVAVRYWGRLARVKTFASVRNSDGQFKGSVVVIQPRNKVNPLAVKKNVVLPR